MNKQIRIFFTTLTMVACIAIGNVIAKSLGEETEQQTAKTEKQPSRQQQEKTGIQTDLLMQHAKESASNILLQRTAYTVLYSKDLRLPVWVAWCLTADHTSGPFKRQKMKFAEDMDVPAPRATNLDYINSGYDRGHMCPSGDNQWSETVQVESFLYTNCCPQLHNLNAGDWEELESQCRDWANKYGEIYIACGPVLLNKKHKTIGKNKIVVPEAFFKVVLCMQDTPKAIGFIYRNERNNKTMSSYVNTIDQVEKITGIDFFPSLPDDIENRIEAHADLEEWD